MFNLAMILIVIGVASYFDLKERIVPNKLIYPSLGIGLIISIINKNYSNIIAAFLICLLLLTIYRINPDILPGGDSKMLVFIVLTGGYNFFVKVLYYTIIFTIPFLIYFTVKQKKGAAKETIPLAAPIFLSCLFVGGSYVTKFF